MSHQTLKILFGFDFPLLLTCTPSFSKAVVGNINCTSAWTLQRKNVHRAQQQQLLSTGKAPVPHARPSTLLLGHPQCLKGCSAAPQLLHHPHWQSLQGSFETGLEQKMGFINNLQNFNAILRNYSQFNPMYFWNAIWQPERENKEILQFSCILFTGRTIHFIYKWLKITNSKQAEA